MDEITDFLFENTPSTVFVLNGYAGTGKSTSIGHLVQYLPRMGFRSVLMAPTGRAAKVMGAMPTKRHSQFTNKSISQRTKEEVVCSLH